LALSIEENISNVGGTHNAVFEQNKTEHISESEDLATPDQFYFHVVDFNENSGRLADADFVSTDYVEECSTLGRSQSSHGFKSTQNFRHKVRLNAPVILKQLDRETIFIAHSNEARFHL
jgi:hypothetical protein